MRRGIVIVIGIAAGACSKAHPLGDAPLGAPDSRASDAAIVDATIGGDDGSIGSIDGSIRSIDAAPGTPDAKIVMTPDAKIITPPDANTGPITGGPCLSQTPGATAYRIRWANGGGTAYAVYEIDGLPDKSRDHAGAYGYQIGFTPQFVDPFLGEGGLQLDGSDFVDLELTTAGLSNISNATLSIYGRSFAVSTDGGFNWQTFVGYNETPTDFVSNVPPYRWYSADMTTELDAGDPNVLIRIKAGPSSDVLVVNRIELCVTAQ